MLVDRHVRPIVSPRQTHAPGGVAGKGLSTHNWSTLLLSSALLSALHSSASLLAAVHLRSLCYLGAILSTGRYPLLRDSSCPLSQGPGKHITTAAHYDRSGYRAQTRRCVAHCLGRVSGTPGNFFGSRPSFCPISLDSSMILHHTYVAKRPYRPLAQVDRGISCRCSPVRRYISCCYHVAKAELL